LIAESTDVGGGRCHGSNGSSFGQIGLYTGMSGNFVDPTNEPAPESNTDSAGEPGGGATTPNPEASSPQGEPAASPPPAADHLILIPGVTDPTVSLYYPGRDPIYDAKTGIVTTPGIPEVQLTETSALVNEFIKEVSPYFQTTAVLNMVENVTAPVLTLSSSQQAQVALAISKAFGSDPSASVAGEGSISGGSSTTETGASTLPERTVISANVSAITLKYQERIAAAIAKERANGGRSALRSQELIRHAKVAMQYGIDGLREAIDPKITAATENVKKALAK